MKCIYEDDYENGIERFPCKRECKRVDAVKVEKVIVLRVLKGEGTPEDPCKVMLQYWDMNGKFLCEVEKN